MKVTGSILVLCICFNVSQAQLTYKDTTGKVDSLLPGTVKVERDWRIEMLGRKMAEYNESLATRSGSGIRNVRGYRLMLLSTTDRTQALNLRSRLLQQYPDQSVYMVFQSPYIKMKFGNFADKKEAERFRNQITSSGLVTNNIYLVPETVQIKVEKIPQGEE